MTPIAIGIVGAGRSRNGLGPFLATFLERSGCRVTAIAARSPVSAEETAARLGEHLGHAVHPCGDLSELCASGIAALVIASPPEHHLSAIEVALSANLPVLCEKPLLHERHLAAGASVVSTFVSRRLLLAEDCQWPFVLPALHRLYGDSTPGPVHHLSLGLAPPSTGRVTVQNNLPHVLSLAQAVAHIDADTMAADISLDKPFSCVPNVLRFRLRGVWTNLNVELHLDHCPTPPRPAWLSIDGVRMDRRIAAGYTFSFVGNGHEVSIADPVLQLVSRFSDYLRMPNSRHAAAETDAVRQRLRLYGDILSRFPEPTAAAHA